MDKKEEIIENAIITGNTIVKDEDLKKAGISFDDFCDRLDNDYRIYNYELINGGVKIKFNEENIK